MNQEAQIQRSFSPLGMGKTDENLSSSEQPSTTVYCKVCGSQATDHLHYGALVCYACRAFFRRQVIKSHLLPCAYNDICVVTKETKDRCPYCRFQKCLQAGMKPGWVMDKQDLEQKRKKASIKKNLGLKTSRTLPKTTYEERMRSERGPKKRKLVKTEDDDSEEFQTIEVDNDSDGGSSSSSNSPGLTNEETSYLKNLLALDIECRSRYPCHINQTAMQQQDTVDLILDWNKTSLERLSYFAYKVHLFQRLPSSDQATLLLTNLKIMQFIEMSSQFQEDFDQLRSHLPLFTYDAFPEDYILGILKDLKNLQMDQTEKMLLISISLFNQTFLKVESKQEIHSVEEGFREMLLRYLRSNSALWKWRDFVKAMSLLQNAGALVSKRSLELKPIS